MYTAIQNCIKDPNCKNNPSQDSAASPTLLKELEEPEDYFCKSNMSEKDMLLLDNYFIDNSSSNQLDSQRKLFCSAFNNKNKNNVGKIIATYGGGQKISTKEVQTWTGLITCIWSHLKQVPYGSTILNDVICLKNYTQLQNYQVVYFTFNYVKLLKISLYMITTTI